MNSFKTKVCSEEILGLPAQKSSSNLDLLRAIAVLLVVFSHLPITDVWLGSNEYLTQSVGLVGVGIFFVHTCLVLMMSIERLIAKEGNEHWGMKFLIRRLFRIYPLSILTVLVVYAISYFTPPPSMPMLISNVMLIQNITGHDSNPGPLWSLPFEVQMYMLLPLLYLRLQYYQNTSLKFLFSMLIGSIVLVFTLWFLHLNYHLVKYIPCFLPGIMAYALRNSRLIIKPWLFFWALLLVAATFPWVVAKGIKENILIWPVCLAIGLTIPRVKEIRSVILKKLGHVVAKYSYGIYLIHGPWITFSFYQLKNVSVLAQWATFFAGVGVISFAAYHLLEEPFIKLGIRISVAMGHKKVDETLPQNL